MNHHDDVEPPRYLISPLARSWYLAWGTDDGIDSEFHGGDDPEAAKGMLLPALRDLAAGRPDHPEQMRPSLDKVVTVFRAQVNGDDQVGIGDGIVHADVFRAMPLHEFLAFAIKQLGG